VLQELPSSYPLLASNPFLFPKIYIFFTLSQILLPPLQTPLTFAADNTCENSDGQRKPRNEVTQKKEVLAMTTKDVKRLAESEVGRNIIATAVLLALAAVTLAPFIGG
jgi:hypothetical protein